MKNVLSGRHLAEGPDAVWQQDDSLVMIDGACDGSPYLAGRMLGDQAPADTFAGSTIAINLPDRVNPVSPLMARAAFRNAAGLVRETALKSTENFNAAFCNKGDIKPATLNNTSFVMPHEAISFAAFGTGGAATAGLDDSETIIRQSVFYRLFLSKNPSSVLRCGCS